MRFNFFWYRMGLAVVTVLAACAPGDRSQAPNEPVLGIAPPGAGMSVSPASLSMATGQTEQLGVIPYDENGNVLWGLTVSWTSSSSSVVTVNASGQVTAVGAGTATITATSGTASGTATLTITGMVRMLRVLRARR